MTNQEIVNKVVERLLGYIIIDLERDVLCWEIKREIPSNISYNSRGFSPFVNRLFFDLQLFNRYCWSGLETESLIKLKSTINAIEVFGRINGIEFMSDNVVRIVGEVAEMAEI